MSIIKKLTVPFTQISNEILNCSTLSFKAKGLYAYLYSKPASWDFSSKRIALDTKESDKSILSALTELKLHGLIIPEKLQSGRMQYTITFTISLSNINSPKPQNRCQPKPLSAKNGSISNKEPLNNKERENNKLSYSLSSSDSAKPQTTRSRSNKRENFSKFRKRIQSTFKDTFTLPPGATSFAPTTIFTISSQGYIIKTNCQNNQVSSEDALIIWQFLYDSSYLDV